MSSQPAHVDGLRAVPTAGIVCMRAGEVLLVRRGQPPRQGEWSIPGGRIEPGETSRAAALRELQEETGVEAELAGLIDVVDAVFHNRAGDLVTRHYIMIDFAARWVSGEPVAGDDADEARFVPLNDLANYHMWPETVRVIQAGAAMADQARKA
ncbi:MAG: NUDIX hydrolase [Alphaproteobacteria bacterium]|nr:NUDIX hydrolase [Alphaproteobacteria bacterium]